MVYDKRQEDNKKKGTNYSIRIASSAYVHKQARALDISDSLYVQLLIDHDQQQIKEPSRNWIAQQVKAMKEEA